LSSKWSTNLWQVDNNVREILGVVYKLGEKGDIGLRFTNLEASIDHILEFMQSFELMMARALCLPSVAMPNVPTGVPKENGEKLGAVTRAESVLV